MKKSVVIELDKIRNLRLGVNARCMAQEILGKPLSDLTKGAGENEIRVLLYCGLIWEDPTLTIEQLGDIMDDVLEERDYEYIGNKIGEAVELSMPSKKKK